MSTITTRRRALAGAVAVAATLSPTTSSHAIDPEAERKRLCVEHRQLGQRAEAALDGWQDSDGDQDLYAEFDRLGAQSNAMLRRQVETRTTTLRGALLKLIEADENLSFGAIGGIPHDPVAAAIRDLQRLCG